MCHLRQPLPACRCFFTCRFALACLMSGGCQEGMGSRPPSCNTFVTPRHQGPYPCGLPLPQHSSNSPFACQVPHSLQPFLPEVYVHHAKCLRVVLSLLPPTPLPPLAHPYLEVIVGSCKPLECLVGVTQDERLVVLTRTTQGDHKCALACRARAVHDPRASQTHAGQEAQCNM
jgi:hypothetical protein